jgi:hypothetical protein
MPDEIAKTDWGSIIYYDDWKTLELKWFPSTKDASDDEVKGTMELFANESEKTKPDFLIVDTTEFFHRWGEGMMDWRDTEIIPHYNAAGVTKFAFIAGDGFPGETVESGAEPAPEGPANFPTGWFESRDSAYSWLGS